MSWGDEIGIVGIGKALEELAGRRVGIESNGLRVGTNERSPEDPRRPPRHVVALETFQQREADLAVRGDGSERYLTPLALAAQTPSEALVRDGGLGCRPGHVVDVRRHANSVPVGCR